jgi:HSP20 family protein
MKLSVITGSIMGLGLLTLSGVTVAQTLPISTPAAQPQTGRTPPAVQPAPAQNALDSRSPWAEMRHMQAEMDRMFDNMFERMSADFSSPPWLGGTDPGSSEVSLRNEQDSYVVKAQVPGIQKGNVKVSLDGRTLKISGTSQSTEKRTESHGKLVQEESQASSFEDAFMLPGPVDASRMQTQIKDGVLTVTVPKANT